MFSLYLKLVAFTKCLKFGKIKNLNSYEVKE